MSELDNIVKALNEEFSKPLGYFEDRKIIIWYDYDKDFLDIIDEVKIDNVKVHKLNKDNYFYTKYLLEEQDIKSNYLIYTNSVENDKNNWLLDMMLYSESFYADKISMLMRELNIEDSLRHDFSKYKLFFNAEKRRNSFINIVSNVSENRTLELGILATISKVKELDFSEIIKSVLCNGILEQENPIYIEIKKYNLEDIFWNYCKSYYGYNFEDRSLKKLFAFIMTTALSNYIKEEYLSNLKNYIGNSKPNCIVLIDHWINHKTDFYNYISYADQYEKEFEIYNIIEKIDIDEYKDIDILKIFDKEIIKYIIFSLEDGREDYDYFISLINTRRTKNFYEDFKNFYEALLSYLKMAKLKLELKGVILQKKASEIIKDYSTKFYNFDFNYRKFYLNYDIRPESKIMNKLKCLVENLYVNWFLSELAVAWNYELKQGYLDNFKINGVINQRDFYKEKIKGMINDGGKVFVIISDALRYEIGMELKEKFNRIVLGSTEVEPMIASIPSITKIGMASLLPNKEITINNNGRVFVDGRDSAGIENRGQILKSNFENSIAIDFNNIPKNKIDFNNMLKGYKLVYIYHNVIDAIGDKANTENDVFTAIEKSIDDIMWLRDKITGWLGGVNIFVTADHGFLYQRSLLEESSKIDREKFDIIDKNRRNIISKEEKEVDGVFRFNLEYLSKENKGIYSYIPKSDMRFKTQGAGCNYVHGGATLQELVVPILYYKHKRTSYKDYKEVKEVSLRLLNNRTKITTEQFMLTFFQVEEVSEEFIPTVYETYMIDSQGNIISNKEKIIADIKNHKPEERNHIVKIKLKKNLYSNRENYRLIIRNVDKGTIIDEIPFIIDIAASDELF